MPLKLWAQSQVRGGSFAWRRRDGKCRIVGERVQQPETDEHPQSNSNKTNKHLRGLKSETVTVSGIIAAADFFHSSLRSSRCWCDSGWRGRDSKKGPSCSGGGKKTTFGINSLHFLPLWLSSSLFSSFDRMPAIRAGGCVPSSVFIRPENTAVGAKWDYLADTGRTTGHFTKEFPYAWLCYCSSRGLAQSQKPYCLILLFMVSASNGLPCWHFAPLRWLLLLSRPVKHLLA